MNTKKLIEEKAKMYGEPSVNFDCCNKLEKVFAEFYIGKDYMVIQSMKNVFRKVARVATGKNDVEHWKDIIGYAQIGMNHVKEEK